MDRKTALFLLGQNSEVDSSSLQSSFQAKRSQLEQRLSEAPTDALKSKYRQELAELQQAYETASRVEGESVPGLSATMVRDLPGARPVYTQEYGSHEPAAGARLTLAEGQVLAGRYEIRRKLGAGGMGAVFAAYDRNRDQEIAVKVLLPGLLRDPQARERFMAEAKLSADLSHPHIVNVYDVQKDGDLHFITMELLEGRTLRQEMDTRKQLKKPFTVAEVKSLASQLCEALGYAHKSTVHRDVKPENIWLEPNETVKLMDFGIARLLSTSQLTMTGTSMGTAYYMAPEQLKGSKNVDGRADQYALAAVLYEMLTGDVPAGKIEPANRVNPRTPIFLGKAIDRALSSDPVSRFPNTAAFADSLNGTVVSNWIESLNLPFAGVPLSILSNRVWVMIAVLSVAIAAGTVAFSSLFHRTHRVQINYSDFWKAASAGDKQEIKAQIDSGISVDKPDPNGHTALYWAIVGNQPEIVQMLLEHHANTKLHESTGDTALHIASGRCSLQIVKDLLDHGADPNATRVDGRSPVNSLADYIFSQDAQLNQQSAIDVVDMLVRKGANINAPELNGGNILETTVAVNPPRYSIAKHLLDLGADPNVRETVLNDLVTPFEWVLWDFDKQDIDAAQISELAQAMIAHHADLNQVFAKETLLTEMISTYHPKAIKFLLEQHANPNLPRPDSLTPMHVASLLCRPDVIQLLYDNGGELNARTSLHKRTPFMVLVATASQYPMVEDRLVPTAEILRRLNADLRAQDADGKTAWDLRFSGGGYNALGPWLSAAGLDGSQ